MKFLKQKKLLFLIGLGICLMSHPLCVSAKSYPRIVTTTSVLADMTREVVGDEFQIDFVASPHRDLHRVSPTPKDVLKTKKADVFIHHGLSAEPWLQPLLNAAGNSSFLNSSGQIIDVSKGIHALEVPEHVSRMDGDIHPQGNPHYWLDPENALKMAKTIAVDMGKLYPDKRLLFEKRAKAFTESLSLKTKEWKMLLAPFKGASVVTYHRSWSYFANRFDLQVIGEIEPKPGIPVTAKHMVEMAELMQQQKARVIIQEPYFNDRASRKIAKMTGAEVVELSQMTRMHDGLDSYEKYMEFNVKELEQAFVRAQGKP